MKHLSPHQKKLVWKIVIITLTVICIASLAYFVSTFKQLYRAGELQPDRVGKKHGDTDAMVTIATIKPWMTFDYLNVVFKLPPTFLQNALAITDTQYPNIRIDTYVKRHGLNPTAFMQGVQQAITSHSYMK